MKASTSRRRRGPAALGWFIGACLLGSTVLGEGGIGVKLRTDAPDFSLQDEQGRNVSLRDYTGKIVVLEWFDPLCDYTKRDYKAKTPQGLAEKYRAKNVAWLAVNSTRDSTKDRNRAWVTEHDLKIPVLDDGRRGVATKYGVTVVPALVIIDPHGTVVYTGAVDDDESREGAKGEGRVDFVDRALAELVEGKGVSKPESRLYGCPLR